jgi:hypothetical protein
MGEIFVDPQQGLAVKNGKMRSAIMVVETPC